MKIKKDFLNNLLSIASKDYQFDLYEYRYSIPNGVKSPKYYIDNTLELYFEYHDTLNLNFFNKVKNVFIEIVKNDKIIELDNKIVLKELYKIICLIDYTNQILDFISENNYPKKYFASYHSSKREIKREEKKHKGMIVNARTPLIHKGEHRLNWWFNNIFGKNPKIVKFYLHSFTLVDLEKCTFIKEEEDEDLQIQLINFLESKLIQRTTDKDILKSLAILLHSEFRHFLKLQDLDSKNYVTEILQTLFNHKPNDEEFNYTIYFRSSIKFMPIFGAKKSSFYTNHEKDFIRRSIFKQLTAKEIKEFNIKEFNFIFDSYIKKPHIQFLRKYPVEFFLQKSKIFHYLKIFTSYKLPLSIDIKHKELFVNLNYKGKTMLTLKGILLNIIDKSEYKKEGESLATPVKAKLQILVETSRANGSKVKELHTISIPDSKIEFYKDKISKEVSVDVGIISKQFSFYGV